MRERNVFATIDHPDRGALTIPGWPVQMSGSHVPVKTSPLLGADNDAVLGGWLDMDASQIAALKDDGVI